MKNGSFEFNKNNFYDKKINIFNNYQNNKRSKSKINNDSFFNELDNNYDDLEIIDSNISQRNQSNISAILSLKPTQKDEIIIGFNNFKKMKMKNKKSKKKKKIDMNNIFNNKKITKANNILSKSFSSKHNLKEKNQKYNSVIISKKLSKSNKDSNSSNNIKIKNIKLKNINNEKKQKIKINTSFINNNVFSKYDNKMMNMISDIKSYKENNIKENINSDSENKNDRSITFGENNPYKIPSKFVYIKKNNICYSNSNFIKSQHKSYFNSSSFSTTAGEKEINPIQKAINDINISEFRIEEDKESDNNSNTDIPEENDNINQEKINKINNQFKYYYL